ncbi:F0F1 ATP synthase subunit gamma [Maribius pontilimi]|uniref:F0F1 ATP synthase subunit gamma n=1 Tax=Palleronia pontilimi TaxID=1964209 RepID=A0A934MG37_9RHOB|nr:FoF1 ATP synthase subunit gamma [Palleronia pontilimi]MBJ3762019.1 F0F1 ATP synthase subunit gamma [Palleronia pontilimi]
MTQTLESLSHRLSSLQGIRSIVHTMKTLSVINAAPYEHAASAIEAYQETILLGLHAFLSQIRPLDPDPSASRARALVVFGSDHGLCGNYNQALASYLAHNADGSGGTQTILCVGAQMADALRDVGLPPEVTVFPPASVDGIGRLANLLTRRIAEIRQDFGTDDMDISLAYFTRDGQRGQRPELAKLLPLDPDLIRDLQRKPWKSRSLPIFTLPRPELFNALIRGHVFASMFRAAAEALVTENAARLAQMQQAEQAVDDRLEDLASEIRSVRQTEITTELLDVIIGFEALKKKRRRQGAFDGDAGRAAQPAP